MNTNASKIIHFYRQFTSIIAYRRAKKAVLRALERIRAVNASETGNGDEFFTTEQ